MKDTEERMSNRVLVLTPNESDAQVLKDVLSKATDGPFDVECASSLAEGLTRLKTDGIDAVLVDLSLPDCQGIETFHRLFSAARHTPIMTLSTIEDDVLAREAVQHGAQGFLSKGYFHSYLVPQALRSVIERKKVEEAFYVERTRAEVTLNSIGDAVISTDMSGNVDYLNVAAERMTGWPKNEARGCPIGEVLRVVNGQTHQPDRNPVELVLQQKVPIGFSANATLIRRDGHEIAIEDSVAPIHDWDGRLTGAVVVFRDITAAKIMSMKLAHLAQHDSLTNLPNRMLLHDRIVQAIAHAKRHDAHVAVLFLDRHNFKNVNDSLGHEIGDKLLQSVAQRLRSCVRSSDTVSRLGGDEFVVVVAEDKHAEGAAVSAEKILSVLGLPHTIDRNELHVTTSIGISIYPTDGTDPEILIKSADTAMYHAKESGRNNYQFFKSEMNVRAVERQVIEANLRRAIEKKEFVLHYQPKVDLKTGFITGAEALVRWMHPVWGMVLPERFVSIAEESGLIVPIGRWVLREACAQAKHWQDAGLQPVTIAVNISALEFRRKDFVDGVRIILEDTGLDAHCLQLEFTESALMRDVQSSTETLRRFKDMGLQLAVDDFGTGHSSLSYLNQFPIDVLKIDRSFVHNITSDDGNGIIASAVIGMGNNLKQRVVAEGVEEQEQLTFLKEHSCDEGQGYLFSRPLAAEQFATLLATGL
jgi:diguanylate cyclase (GGDEF)-like protein/PAS domain S-box-containing protein